MGNEGNKWEYFTGFFTAQVPYTYMLVGNFKTDNETVVKRIEAPLEFGYYYLDGFELVKIPPIVKTPENPINLLEIPMKVGENIPLYQIYFQLNEFEILPRSFKQLDNLIALLSKYEAMKIEIQGHTDDQGSDEYNIQLSTERAQAVYAYLINGGIEQKRLSFQGFGRSKPMTSNTTASGREVNRRVSFLIKSM